MGAEHDLYNRGDGAEARLPECVGGLGAGWASANPDWEDRYGKANEKGIVMRWTEEQYNDFLRRRDAGNKNSTAGASGNMESAPGNEPLGKKEIPRLDSPCRIHLHSRRHRLTDSDGVSGKAAIDGLVHCGLLPDDSPEYVESVSFTQEKIPVDREESTEITIRW